MTNPHGDWTMVERGAGLADRGRAERASAQAMLDTTRPCSAAQTPIWVRETKSSLFRMCSMCAATVRSVITSDSPI